MIRRRMAKVVEKPKVKQLGVMVNVALWKDFKKMAVDKEITATELLEEAMRKYLEKPTDQS